MKYFIIVIILFISTITYAHEKRSIRPNNFGYNNKPIRQYNYVNIYHNKRHIRHYIFVPVNKVEKYKYGTHTHIRKNGEIYYHTHKHKEGHEHK